MNEIFSIGFFSRLPCFVELVEKFLIICHKTLSGMNVSQKQEIALYLIPEVSPYMYDFFHPLQQGTIKLFILILHPDSYCRHTYAREP